MYKKAFAIALLLVGFSSAAHAAGLSDPLIEGAKQCTRYFPTEEQTKAIPVHLLAAISTTETGRWHDGLGMSLPWPWTINVEGKGYYFGSKAEAIAATQKFLREGKRSIDVGCMQVNLKHHPKAFANLNEAFDPATNVAYAAQFLKNNYDEMGNWIQAAAAYHSRTSHLGRSYLARVERNWIQIVNKVRAARGQAPLVSANAGAAADTARPQAARVAAMRPMRTLNEIKVVSAEDTPQIRRNDVLVIRTPAADVQESAVSVANARIDSGGGNWVDNPAPAPHSSAGSVTYVFAN